MAITLTSDEYDEIRLLIGGDIDDEDLSDARINGGTVLGAAESYALRRIPGGQNGLSTAEMKAYRRAILYRCAWILVPSFPEQIAEAAGQLSARYQGTIGGETARDPPSASGRRDSEVSGRGAWCVGRWVCSRV